MLKLLLITLIFNFVFVCCDNSNVHKGAQETNILSRFSRALGQLNPENVNQREERKEKSESKEEAKQSFQLPAVVHVPSDVFRNNGLNENKDGTKQSLEENKSDISKSDTTKNNISIQKPALNSQEIKNGTNTTLLRNPLKVSKDMLQSGALLRGFYVFLALSMITMFYFVFRSYRLRRNYQPSTTVKKYGVTARRGDMEMRPLELDEDEDDTLFDVNHTSNR